MGVGGRVRAGQGAGRCCAHIELPKRKSSVQARPETVHETASRAIARLHALGCVLTGDDDVLRCRVLVQLLVPLLQPRLVEALWSKGRLWERGTARQVQTHRGSEPIKQACGASQQAQQPGARPSTARPSAAAALTGRLPSRMPWSRMMFRMPWRISSPCVPPRERPPSASRAYPRTRGSAAARALAATRSDTCGAEAGWV